MGQNFKGVPWQDRVAEPILDRLMRRIVVDDAGCWVWQGSRTSGYGNMMVGSRRDFSQRVRTTHVLMWEEKRGPVPKGMELDHLCRNRACCNPDHLEVVTHRTNMLRSTAPAAAQARQTHCKRGHEFTDENTWRDKKGKRYCRACRRVSK